MLIALWTHPDIGQGLFYIIVAPLPGNAAPEDLRIKIGVQPESLRLPEAFYTADCDDRDEFWRVHLIIESAAGNCEPFSQVETTPSFMGRFGLVFFCLLFLGGGLSLVSGDDEKTRTYPKAASGSDRSKTNQGVRVYLRKLPSDSLYNVEHSVPSSSRGLCGN